MIVYAVFSNQGGMKRVSEAQLQQKHRNDVIYVNFSEKEEQNSDKSIVWIHWKNVSQNYTTEKIDYYQHEISKLVDMSKIKYVIGDCLTLPYFSSFNVEFIYDIHSLSLPMHQQMQEDFSYLSMDQLTDFPTANVIRLNQVSYTRYEYLWLKRSIGFISNSENSTFYLKKYYPDVIEDKPIFQVPVISFMEKSKRGGKAFKYPFFTFSRWHPQKGYHLLFKHDWKEFPLSVRGVSPKNFSEKGLNVLSERAINILPWTDNSASLSQELADSDIVLFPAVYEPYGLALEEALSVGCLCIAHRNQSGHEEQITDGVNGILIDFRSEDFMDNLKKISLMPENEKQRIRENAMTSNRSTMKERDAALEAVFNWLRLRSS